MRRLVTLAGNSSNRRTRSSGGRASMSWITSGLSMLRMRSACSSGRRYSNTAMALSFSSKRKAKARCRGEISINCCTSSAMGARLASRLAASKEAGVRRSRRTLCRMINLRTLGSAGMKRTRRSTANRCSEAHREALKPLDGRAASRRSSARPPSPAWIASAQADKRDSKGSPGLRKPQNPQRESQGESPRNYS